MKAVSAALLALCVGMLCTVAGCEVEYRDNNIFADLDGDGKPDIIFWEAKKSAWSVEHDLMVICSSDSHHQPRLIRHFNESPTELRFIDMNGDGYPDMITTMTVRSATWNVGHNTYVAINDGRGFFGDFKLIRHTEG